MSFRSASARSWKHAAFFRTTAEIEKLHLVLLGQLVGRREMEILHSCQAATETERFVRKVTTLLGFYDTQAGWNYTLMGFSLCVRALGASGVSLTLYSSISEAAK